MSEHDRPTGNDGNDIPEHFLEHFFQHSDDPRGWIPLHIVFEPEDESVDQAGDALKAASTDALKLGADVAAEYSAHATTDEQEPMTPDAIPMDAVEVQATADQAMPELADDMAKANETARQARERVRAAIKAAGTATRDALDAHLDEARQALRAAMLVFHAWGMAEYRRCVRAYQATNQWVDENPLALAVITVVVSAIVSMALS